MSTFIKCTKFFSVFALLVVLIPTVQDNNRGISDLLVWYAPFALAIPILVLSFWATMFIDFLNRKNVKNVWLWCALLTIFSYVGAIAYYFIYYKKPLSNHGS